MFTNSIAKAKLQFNKKLKTYKLICAFNVYEKQKRFSEDNLVYKFPVQKKCDYVSGDITLEDLPRVLATASKVLRTNNIVIVE
jgi:hypothetical protein